MSPGSASPAPVAARVEILPELPAPLRRALVKPLAPERYEIRFTASAETHAKLRQAQDLLRHVIPDGDVAQVMDRALTTLLAELSKRKFAATDRLRPGRARSAEARDPAAEVRRAVWKRDGGRCRFVAKDGRRCSARGRLEFHHLWPTAENGKPSIDNIELRCRAHNLYEADLFYGASDRVANRSVNRQDPRFLRENPRVPEPVRLTKPIRLLRPSRRRRAVSRRAPRIA